MAAAAPTVNARSGGRDTSEVEPDLLRWLAVMPFLSYREMETLAEWSDTAVYDALSTLERGRLVAGVNVSAPGASTTRRWFLAPSGVEAVAAITGVGLQNTLRTRPVSAHWVRLLAERMDAVTPVYRLVSELAGVTGIRGFRWYRGHPLDALVAVQGGRLLGVMREGRSALPSHLGQRLRSLMHGRRPDAIAVLAPDSLRLRDWTAMMERSPITAILALEQDVMTSGDGDAIYHVPSDPDPWPLRRAVRLARGGSVPVEQPLSRVSPPPVDIQGEVREVAAGRTQLRNEDHLLSLALDAGSKRVLDLIALWPWTGLADLKDLLGVSRTRTYQLLDRPLRLGLVVRTRHDGRARYALADRGIAFHARRDRVATSMALRRWSPSRSGPESPLSWQSVRGSRTRQLARHIDHTAAVHSFMAAISRQARETGGSLVEAEPPHPGRAHVSRLWRRVRLGQPRRIRAHRDGARRAPPLPGGGAQGRVERAFPRQAPAIPSLLRQRAAPAHLRGMAFGAIRPPRRDRRDGPVADERRRDRALRGWRRAVHTHDHRGPRGGARPPGSDLA